MGYCLSNTVSVIGRFLLISTICWDSAHFFQSRKGLDAALNGQQNPSGFWGAYGQVDRELDLWSEGLGFDSHYWSCVEVSGKLLITYCLCSLSSNGYLVEWNIGKLWMALAAENVLNSPQRRWDHIRESSNTRGVNCTVCWTHGDFRLQAFTFTFLSTFFNLC